MIRRYAFIAILVGLALSSFGPALPAAAQDGGTSGAFSATEKDDIRAIVRDYLLENPEVLIESLQLYQERQEAAQRAQQRESIAALKETLEQDPNSPVIGNPDGDVVLIEFFDYHCPYCKRVAPDLRALVEEDGNIRLVMKELPILGPPSRYAAQAALAAAKQGKYEEMHFALMNLQGDLGQLTVMKLAQDLGIDIEQLQTDMRDPEINAELRRTYETARALQINGTPAFIIGDQLMPGAMSAAALKQVIAEHRANPS